MLAVKPVLECVNAATVVPPSANEFAVGAAAISQTVPLADNAAPPLDVTVAPSVAEVVAIVAAVGEFRVGAVGAVPVSITSSILIDAVPVFTNLIFKPLIWAELGKLRFLEEYQPTLVEADSLNNAVEEFAITTQLVPL